MTIIIYTRDNDTTQFLKNEILTTFLNEQIDFLKDIEKFSNAYKFFKNFYTARRCFIF